MRVSAVVIAFAGAVACLCLTARVHAQAVCEIQDDAGALKIGTNLDTPLIRRSAGSLGAISLELNGTLNVAGATALAGGVKLGVAGGSYTPTSLTSYEEGTFTVTFPAGLAFNTAQNVQFSFVRVGRMVTIEWPDLTGIACTSSVSSYIGSTAAIIPARLVSSKAVFRSVHKAQNTAATNGGVITAQWVWFSDGTFQIYTTDGSGSGQFNFGTGTCGFYAGSVTWRSNLAT